MAYGLPFCITILGADPGVPRGRHGTAHEEQAERLGLAGENQREHGDAGAEISRASEGDEEQGRRGGGRDRDADSVAEGHRIHEAVDAAAHGEDADERGERVRSRWGQKLDMDMSDVVGMGKYSVVEVGRVVAAPGQRVAGVRISASWEIVRQIGLCEDGRGEGLFGIRLCMSDWVLCRVECGCPAEGILEL